MAGQHPGEQPPDVSAEPGPPPESGDTRVTTRPGPSRLVSPSVHRWPGGIDHGAAAAPPAEPAPEAGAELAPEAGAEPAPEAGAEPAPEAGAEPAPEAEAGDAPEQDPPQSSTVVRAWSAVPLPLRIALALLFLPPTGYVLALRSGWSTGVKLGAVTAWTALLLLAPVMLARVPGAPVHLPISSATPPALAVQDEVAATTPSSHGGMIASPAGARHPASTVSPGSTLAPGTTPTPGTTSAPVTTPSPAPTTAPTAPGAPPTPGTTPVATPAGTCGAPQNPWGYNLCDDGTPVTSPPPNFCSVFNCVPHFGEHRAGAGAVVECSDGTYAEQSVGPGSCMPHGGELHQLYGP